MPKRRQVVTDLLVGAAICAAVVLLGREQGHSWLHVLCDGTFVAAVMLLGVGGLVLARNKGTFDVAGYGTKVALNTALPFLHSEKETILEYKERKARARKSPSALFLSGGCFLALSIIFLIAYSNAPQ